MTEEEKKAYNFLKFYSNDTENEYFDENYCFDKKQGQEIIKIIEKQQKEIEQQAKEIERQDRNIHKLNLDKIQQQKTNRRIRRNKR